MRVFCEFFDELQKNSKRWSLYLERRFYMSEDSLIKGIKAILAEEYSRELSKKITNAYCYRRQNGVHVMLIDKILGYKNHRMAISVSLGKKQSSDKFTGTVWQAIEHVL